MKPNYFKIKLATNQAYERVKQTLKQTKINTVCIEARCPNRIECWSKNAMTFMILGNICTRHCHFCAVTSGNPNGKLDPHEAAKIVNLIKKLNLNYVTITSVTRDDLADGGGSAFAKTVTAIKESNCHIKVEVLVPDFQGNEKSLQTVVDAGCDVFAHNIETVERLSKYVRDPNANYTRSLNLLKKVHEYKPDLILKSGFMVGLGENHTDVKETINDLAKVGISVLTIGQYLQPAPYLLPVVEYVDNETFNYYRNLAINSGIKFVFAGPLIRSSYARI